MKGGVGKLWLIYDGRAHSDTSDATVLEACTSRRDLEAALETWEGHDAFVYQYDTVGANAENEQLLGHIAEGTAVLLARTRG